MPIDLRNIGSISPNGVGTITVPGNVNITGTPAPQFLVNGVPIGAVTTVFGRSGAVVATNGDYTAAQVTNAVDSSQSYANPAWITSLAWSKVTGAPAFLTATGAVTSISPGGLVGNVTLTAGANVSITQTGQTITIASVAAGVSSISPGSLTGNVTLTAGANVSITQSGQTITIASTGGGSGGTSQWIDAVGGGIYYGGNVGIMTAAPECPLDLNGMMRITSASGNPTSGPCLEMYYVPGLATGAIDVWDYTANVYRRLRLDGDPLTLNLDGMNTGVGMANPQCPLEVNGVTRITNNLGFPLNGGGVELYYSPGNAIGAIDAWDYTANVYRKLRLTGNPLTLNSEGGNVGIGTENPSTGRLEVVSLNQTDPWTSAQIILREATVNPDFGLALSFISPSGGWLGSIQSRSGGLPGWLTLNPQGGRVGVNTINPQATLDTGGAIAPIKVATYGGTADGTTYGIGVDSFRLTFGANINAITGTPQMMLDVTGGGSGTLVVNHNARFDPGNPHLQVSGGLCVNSMADNGLACIRMVSTDQAWGVGWHFPGEMCYLFATNPWDAFGGWARWIMYFDCGNGNVSMPNTLTAGAISTGNLTATGNIQCNGTVNAAAFTVNGQPLQTMGSGWTAFACDIRNSTGNTPIELNWGYAWYNVQGNLCFISIMFNVTQTAPVNMHTYLPFNQVGYSQNLYAYSASPAGNQPASALANITTATNTLRWSLGTAFGNIAGGTWIVSGVYQIA